jgi:uncharacterized membrane protein
MAGIGFELKRQTQVASLLSHMKTLTFAGLISCGPWVFSIVTLFVIASISLNAGMHNTPVQQFLVTVTYLVAHSLIISGGFQLVLTRYTADLIFTGDGHAIFSALLGCLSTMLIVTLPIASLLGWQLSEISPAYGIISAVALLTLCTLWVCILFLSSIRAYRQVITALILGYCGIMLLVLLQRPSQASELLLAFTLGQLLAVFLLLRLIAQHYPATLPQQENQRGLISLSFTALKPSPLLLKLFLCGLFYNLAIWIDKIIFWFSPTLSEPIVGWFRASLIYDLPIFMANLVIIPGLAVFLLTTEADFAEKCMQYFEQLNKNANLKALHALKLDMLNSYRDGLVLLCKVQAIATLFLILVSDAVFNALSIEPIYRQIFCVDLIGMSFLLIVMSQLNTLYYLDHLKSALTLVVTLLVTNALFTVGSIEMGIQFYGYGFTAAAILTSITGLQLLNRSFSQLEMRSFMRQN